MIISRSPLRVSFTGGGSDIASFYSKFGGAVISTTIDKYMYVTVNKKFDNKIRLSYSKTEEVDSIDQLEHKYVKEILKHMNLDGWLEITSIADIPSKGSGLGSSSSFCISTLHALHAYKGQYVSPEQLAQESCMIEIEKCEEPIGKQDQYACAYGGLNFIKFNPNGSVLVEPIICLDETRKRLSDNLIMLYTGITRSASNILANQSQEMVSDEKKQDIMKEMVKLTYSLKKELEDNNLQNFGHILHQNWILKKEMSGGISNPQIDERYKKATMAGAEGGKILGAGGGGFFLFYAPKEKHESIYNALPELRKVKFNFDNDGSKIIFIN